MEPIQKVTAHKGELTYERDHKENCKQAAYKSCGASAHVCNLHQRGYYRNRPEQRRHRFRRR